MRYRHIPDAHNPDDAGVRPSECPACRSKDVVTASKVVTAASYWRCQACDEVWNAGRLKAASRFSSSSSPWR